MKSVLVVRRDNIGDLVCTTPLFAALRRAYPQAWIGALVNSYNAAVLDRNPDLDEVVVYTKLKHLEPGQSAFAALARRVGELWRLRRRRLDCVVLANPLEASRTLALARALAPKRIVSLSAAKVHGVHQVERVFALAADLGIEAAIPPLKLVPDPALVEKAKSALKSRFNIALQISARRPAQQWPAQRFAELARRLDGLGFGTVLLWAPGPSNHPRHPGDDEKAQQIAARLGGTASFVAYRTERLAELIGALAACDALVTSDGGAMHLAAALQKPIVCFFGDVAPEQWRPWGAPHRVLRPASHNAADIGVEQALGALRELTQHL